MSDSTALEDAEVVTLCVAQATVGIPSDRRFLAIAGERLAELFPELPAQPGYFKRRRRLSGGRLCSQPETADRVI